MAPIKIILFDDSKRIRDSLEILFTTNPEFDWRGGFADASEAIEILTVHSPHVVLMDVDMPRISGIEATQNIKKKFPRELPISRVTGEFRTLKTSSPMFS